MGRWRGSRRGGYLGESSTILPGGIGGATSSSSRAVRILRCCAPAVCVERKPAVISTRQLERMRNGIDIQWSVDVRERLVPVGDVIVPELGSEAARVDYQD